jgi:hypothetical protein
VSVTKKAILSIDLAALAGTMTYHPGSRLPRHDKQLLERTITLRFLSHLCQFKGLEFSSLCSVEHDPPDVRFTIAGQSYAAELAELLPENRLEKDAIIEKLRRDIVSEISLSERTANQVITISLASDYSSKLRPGRVHSKLARAINAYFEGGVSSTQRIPVPDAIRNSVKQIDVFEEELVMDSRRNDSREPLLVFTAQHTMIVPEDDCPRMVSSVLSRKGLHDLSHPTWLLLWSNHHALSDLRDQIDNAIGNFLRENAMAYERVFHLHLFPHSGATEFPMNTT